jgi:beta-glucanase (GH16 family)
MSFKKVFLLSIFVVLVLLIGPGSGPVMANATDGFYVIADFEGGIPAGFVGFADSWDGSGSSTTLALNTANVELPTVPDSAGNTVASVDFAIAASGSWGGGPGYGGVTHDFAATEDWSGFEHFTFWFNGSNSGAEMRVELKSDGANAGASNRYEYAFTDDGAGWRFFNLPWDAFTRRFDFNPGPSPDDPINLEAMWGYSILLPGGASGTFYLDRVALTNTSKIADFEGGIPAGFVGFADSWDGSGSTTTLSLGTANVALPTVPDSAGNTVVSVEYNIAASGSWGGGPGYGGVTQDFAATQDWSDFESFTFWFYGSNSGAEMRVELKSDGANAGASNRYEYTFADDSAGWRFFNLSWNAFTRRFDFNPGPSPDDPINLAAMWGYSILLPGGANGTFYLDHVALHSAVAPEPWMLVDDFEDGVEPGIPCVGIPLGFCTFAGTSTAEIAAATTPPAPVLPELGEPNTVIKVDLNVSDFAGFIRGFTNEAGDTWTPRDWSAFEGFGFWIYGNNSGTSMFIDLLENRNPDSTTDDAERWTVAFTDDFAGWRNFEFPFSDLTRKDVGNGAPNDGFTGDEMHGWAFGTLGTEGDITYYLDQAYVYGVAPERPLEVQFTNVSFEAVEGSSAVIGVELTRPLKEGDPDQVSVSYMTEPGLAIPDRDYTPVSGTLTFFKDDVSEQTFTVPTFDNNKRDGDKTVILRLYEPVDVPLGSQFQSWLDILDDEELDPTLLDDFERGVYLWESNNVSLGTPEIAAGDPLAVPGQGAYEHILEVDTALVVDIIVNGNICNGGEGVIPVALLTTDSFDALTVDHNTVRFGDAYEAHQNKKTGEAKRHEEDFDGDGDLDLVFHFGATETGYDCDTTQLTLTGETYDGKLVVAGSEASFGRDFAIGQDWTRGEALSFWFYGTNNGDPITLQLKDNRAPDPGPSDWNMVWSDEFDNPAGMPPNPAKWSYEVGDGTVNRIPGWGNSELQYYTNSTENSATDGNGNLVITVKEADGSLVCYYGPCEYTSARLVSQYKAEFAYGRIESRILVPDGAAGLWPAFWSLGTDIWEVGWPQTGEIDFMEYVSRLPEEIFGTIHGPGYSGGSAFGNIYQFGEQVSNDYHTFAIEWEPDLIRWYVDDYLYHTATPADVAPNEWVFNDPVYMLFNIAVGGNFGGQVDPELTFPQEMAIDYVRVYQGPDTAERWEATFADNFEGWQQVTIPFASLTRSAEQPDGAPDDGLTLSEVWGYGFELPEGGTTSGTMRLDQVRLELLPPPLEITVTNLNDSGEGSLRQALKDIAIGGKITFEPGLAGGTIVLTTGPLVPGHSVTIDASDAPGITLDGGGVDRLLIVDAGLEVHVAHVTMTNGYGFQLAGGILNNGALSLDHVTVAGNTMTTPDTGQFWQGGGGIYTGEGGSLTLVDSAVSDNSSGWAGGGVYSFLGSITIIERSTISGNSAQDVGGGLRTLSNVTIDNSTISGNTAIGWHGGGAFITDGVVEITNSTVANNSAPAGTAGGLFVGTFTDAGATLNLTNSILANSQLPDCFAGFFGAGAVVLSSGGHNVASDNSCNLVAAGDQPSTDPLLSPLADNGGPTFTHALDAGSPAIDAANGSLCPAVDQRGVTRPQGAGCDVGSFEFVP